MTSPEEFDPLASLLNSDVLPPNDPSRREAIFAQTRGVLQRRRLMMRGMQIASLAACYVVGVLSVLGWQSFHPHNDLVSQRNLAIDQSKAISVEEPIPSPTSPSGNTLEEVGSTNSQSQQTETLTKFERLRRAGDRQLNEKGNFQGAIGCYRRALDVASDDELKIVPERDSWLLIPLKEVRLEARKHAQKKS